MPESIVIDESSVIEYQSAGHLTLRGALPRAKVQGVRATVERLVRGATGLRFLWSNGTLTARPSCKSRI